MTDRHLIYVASFLRAIATGLILLLVSVAVGIGLLIAVVQST